MISGFRACRYWLATKLHFTTRKYDIFKHKAKVLNFDEERFLARKDNKLFERLANKYGEAIHEFYVANLLVGNKNLWDSSGIDSHDVYFNWLARKNSRVYHLKKDLGKHSIFGMDVLRELVEIKDGRAKLFDLFVSGSITPETIVALDSIVPFLEHWDTVMVDTLWGSAALVLLKYRPFLNVKTPEIFEVLDEYYLTSYEEPDTISDTE